MSARFRGRPSDEYQRELTERRRARGDVAAGKPAAQKRRPQHTCDRCRTPLLRWAALDAWWCPRCDRWAESTCGDPSCAACAARPELPSMMLRRQRALV